MAVDRTTWTLARLLDWVVQVDVAALGRAIDADRTARPDVTDAQRIDEAFTKAQRKTTLTALATGLPANPWIALPAASFDVALTLRAEIQAVAQAALIHDPAFFDDETAAWTLLVPVLGIGASSQLARSLGVAGTHHLTRSVLQRVVTQESLRHFKRVMLRYFGLRVTRRGVMTKSVPLVGAVIGAGWNYAEMAGIRRRTAAFLEHRAYRRRLPGPAARSVLTAAARRLDMT